MSVILILLMYSIVNFLALPKLIFFTKTLSHRNLKSLLQLRSALMLLTLYSQIYQLVMSTNL